MTVDWTPLTHALAACRRDSVAVPFWWRDDDAIAPTAALDQLGILSNETGMPLHLAVIPAHVEAALPQAVEAHGMIPVVHGWAHVDHSTRGEKKNEFNTVRPSLKDEAQQGLQAMQAAFGAQTRPMFVPPWNRIHPNVVRELTSIGFTTLSTFGPRSAAYPHPGLTQINTHIDPIWWKETRDLVDPDHLIAQAAQHLEARRTGAQDAQEPFGLLTHHLVHTPAIWSFTAAFVHEMMSGGAIPWAMERTT